jgi:hypothetical protein
MNREVKIVILNTMKLLQTCLICCTACALPPLLDVSSVGSNPAYSPEAPNSSWFAMMFSGGMPSSNATGWKQGTKKTDQCFIEPLTINCHILEVL